MTIIYKRFLNRDDWLPISWEDAQAEFRSYFHFIDSAVCDIKEGCSVYARGAEFKRTIQPIEKGVSHAAINID
jgi:hypothetical protein